MAVSSAPFCTSFQIIRLASISIVFVILIFSSVLSNGGYYNNYLHTAYALYSRATPSTLGPIVNDPNLKVEVVAKGLQSPTSMAFLGPNDILVLEKNTGNVLRVVNGKILKSPLLHSNVATAFVEWGLLGIATSRHDQGEEGKSITYVFLYYTVPGSNINAAAATAAGNRLYRYELVNNHLVNPKLLLNLPANSPNPLVESNHNGGKVLIGPDQNVYIVIGDVGGHKGQSQNVKNGLPLDGTSGILRVTQDGQPVSDPPLGDSYPANLYYASGIRNSFGIDFDPITGKLWDSENGPTYGDEINLVDPGFNSGWVQVQGVWKVNGPSPGPAIGGDTNDAPRNLVTFNGKGVYRAPEFTWLQPVAPTALKFLNSSQLGTQYKNDMFVGDVDTGSIYHFRLNQQRNGLVLTGSLAGKVANTPQDSQQIVFAHGFSTITDLQVGPDGYLYVLTIAGTIYRIVPLHPISNDINGQTSSSPSMSNNIKPLLHHQKQSLTTTPSSPASKINNNNINNHSSKPGILEEVS
jgi:aldose sugar dehydrogenase